VFPSAPTPRTSASLDVRDDVVARISVDGQGALLVRFVRDREIRSRKVLAYIGPLVLMCIGSLALDLHEALGEVIAGKQDYLFVGNEHRTNPALTLINRPIYFVGFDFPTFLTRPFTSPWEDAKGRQWFWNYLLKTFPPHLEPAVPSATSVAAHRFPITA
jgi:hypothetical protein